MHNDIHQSSYPVYTQGTAREQTSQAERSSSTQVGQQPRSAYVGHATTSPGSASNKPKSAPKMSKARTLTLATRMKQLLAVASIVSFGAFGGLVALHQTSASTATSSSNTTSSTTTTTSSTTSSSQNSSSSLNQSGNNFGSSSSSSSTTVSSSSVS